MRTIVTRATLAALLILVPVFAFAQASITGSARDSSGATLPGVTVEVSSPVLIEKVRTTVTDERGLFRVVGLPPGTYSVTFALPGFQQVKRDGVELTGSFIAQIDANLSVGGVTETITVSGASPIVDVQSIRRQTTITNEVLTAIPTARSWAATALLIPGIMTTGGGPTDVQVTPQMTVFGGQGGRNNEGRMQVDGLNAGAGLGGSGVSTYVADISNAQEVVTTTSGGLGEVEVGGPSLSIIPKSGGNTIRGAAYVSGVGGGWWAATTPTRCDGRPDHARQAAQAVGLHVRYRRADHEGPPVVLRDGARRGAAPVDSGHLPEPERRRSHQVPLRAGSGARSRGAESWRLYSARITYQATSRDKINLHWDEQQACNGATFTSSGDGCRQQPESEAVFGPLGLGGLTSTTSPEIGGYLDTTPRVRLLTWQSTATNRLLFEAGFGAYQSPFGPRESPGNNTRGLARVVEQCAAGCSANGGIPNLTYRSANWGHSWDAQYTWRASVSYVTGAHNLKIGYGGVALVSDLLNNTNDLNLPVSPQQRRAEPAYPDPAAVHHQLPHPQRVLLRAGPVDARPDDAPGRAALRSQLELLAGADDSCLGVPPVGAGVSGDARRQRLQGHLAARRHRLRRVRQRQDRREGERRQIPGADQQQQQLHPVQSDPKDRHHDDPDMDRCGHRFRRPTATCGARWPTASAPPWPRARSGRRPGRRPPSTRRSWTGGAAGPTTGRSARRCSSRCCRASRWKPVTSTAG